MSKIFNEFEKKKLENSEKLYLFKSGIFYISLNEDAKKLSQLFGFKITSLNEKVTKVGFPAKKLEFYTNILTNCSIDFEIVDSNYGKIENQKDYLNNKKIEEIIKSLKELDMNKISFEDAFYILKKINTDIKNLTKEDVQE